MVEFTKFKSDLPQYGFDITEESDEVWGRAFHDDVEIGWDVIASNKTRVGIDPKKYFDKTSSCSVLGFFPMTDEEYYDLIQFLLQYALDKGKQGEYWRTQSSVVFCGDFRKIGTRE